MYQVRVQSFVKKGKVLEDNIIVQIGEVGTPEYEEGLHHLENLLFGLEVEYDDIEGDGDLAIDDMLISASELEAFEVQLEGKKYLYIINGII